MDIVIAGGHGKIALRLERLLTERGHHLRALIRNSDHAGDVVAAGADPLVVDLEAVERRRAGPPRSAVPARSSSRRAPDRGAGPSASGRSTTPAR